MLCLACKPIDYLVPESFEKDRAEVSYSIDTIGYLKNEIQRLVFVGSWEVMLIMGCRVGIGGKNCSILCNFVFVNRPTKEELIDDQMNEFCRKKWLEN